MYYCRPFFEPQNFMSLKFMSDARYKCRSWDAQSRSPDAVHNWGGTLFSALFIYMQVSRKILIPMPNVYIALCNMLLFFFF